MWTRRHTDAILIGLWMDILWHRSVVLVGPGLNTASKKSKTRLDVSVGRVKLRSSGVCVEGVRCLVVARLVLETMSALALPHAEG